MTMYEKIQILCKNQGFEISNLGDKIPGTSVTKGTISKWKKGVVPRANTLKAIANYFGVTVDYLLGNTDTADTPSKKTVDDSDIKVAIFGGDGEVTDEMWNEVRNFTEYVKEKYRKK